MGQKARRTEERTWKAAISCKRWQSDTTKHFQAFYSSTFIAFTDSII